MTASRQARHKRWLAKPDLRRQRAGLSPTPSAAARNPHDNRGPTTARLGRTTVQLKARLLASGALMLVAAIGTSAHAQSRQATTAAAAASNTTIEELVVTAEKRSQSLQDVPVAISAFTSERRDL